jgi:poly[ADP-ribose] polymerase 16
MLMAGTDNQLKMNVIDIIHWILTAAKFDVETIHKTKHDEVLSLAKNSSKHQVPNHIFKITYNENSGAEKKFQLLSRDMMRKFVYHGTKFYHAYTILSYGLQQHLNKTGLFGEGLYFAFELQISALFSPSVLSWSKSKLGDLMSCVALCEYIDDPRHYKIQKENAKNSDIPQNYLLITNNEIVRVRYLLLYGSKKPTLKSILSKDRISTSSQQPNLDAPSSFLTWCRRNPMLVSACIYVILLILVGLNQSRSVEHYKNVIKRFIQRYFKFE